MEIDRFLLCFTLYLRAISKYKPLGSSYLEGRFNGGFFAFTSLGGLQMEGLILGCSSYTENFWVVLHIPRIEIVNHSYTELGGTKEQWAQRNTKESQRNSGHKSLRNSGHRGIVGTEEQWAQRNIGHRGTVGDRGTVGTEEQWAQRNSGHREIVGTEKQ